jgi:hypothetical protein
MHRATQTGETARELKLDVLEARDELLEVGRQEGTTLAGHERSFLDLPQMRGNRPSALALNRDLRSQRVCFDSRMYH